MNEYLAPLSGTSPSPAPVAQALEYLRLALACLDEADEVTAPPYVQNAIDVIQVNYGNDEPAAFSAFSF